VAATPARPPTPPPPAPSHLEKAEKTVWADLVSRFVFDDPGSYELLSSAMDARCRMRRCRQAINKDGETFIDPKGCLRPHPLLAAERSARASYLHAMRMLKIDVKGTK